LNRRFAPLTNRLKAVPDKNMITISKNRVFRGSPVRRVVYDEFIHPLDTAVYLLDDEIIDFTASCVVNQAGHALRMAVKMETKSATAFVNMNLQSGANTEHFEVMSPSGTCRVDDLSTLTTLTRDGKSVDSFGDWTDTLEKRGFIPMVLAFLDKAVGKTADLKQQNVLLSHELCERVIQSAWQAPT
jgi:virulence factor